MKEAIPRILAYMQETIATEQTIAQIAEHFGYSKYHFSRMFKQHTGFSAADYLSSLKVEHAKQALLQRVNTVSDSGWDAGYTSIGTFSTTFKKKTGLSPLAYKQQVEALYDLAKTYEDSGDAVSGNDEQPLARDASHCQITLSYPPGYRPGVTFVGLFRTPIPNHRPVIGVALSQRDSHCLQPIPSGTYYLLACSIEKSFNPLRYFVLDDCLRARIQPPIRFPQANGHSFHLQLREPEPEDPPIVMNLPKLLADALRR